MLKSPCNRVTEILDPYLMIPRSREPNHLTCGGQISPFKKGSTKDTTMLSKQKVLYMAFPGMHSTVCMVFPRCPPGRSSATSKTIMFLWLFWIFFWLTWFYFHIHENLSWILDNSVQAFIRIFIPLARLWNLLSRYCSNKICTNIKHKHIVIHTCDKKYFVEIWDFVTFLYFVQYIWYLLCQNMP
jgi:hypothetical protein